MRQKEHVKKFGKVYQSEKFYINVLQSDKKSFIMRASIVIPPSICEWYAKTWLFVVQWAISLYLFH